MEPDPKKLIFDMVSACREIGEYTHGKSFDDYRNNSLLRSAVERQFEILGEAAVRLRDHDPRIWERLPQAHAIVGLRNRLIHGYDTIDDAIIWSIVEEKAPPLAAQLEELLSEP